jgi:hypothetical protein
MALGAAQVAVTTTRRGVSSMSTTPEVLRPWRVVNTNGVMLSGHDNEADAVARCDKANADAEQLNIADRYVIKRRRGE